jgi:ketosteroid isomerase-like protein
MEHPNVTRAREAMSALAAGDTEPVFARMRDDIVNLNDIGAGPWREQHGKEAMMRFWAEWMDLFDGTFRQDILDAIGYDDRVVLIIHETGTAQNQAFDNRAIYLLEVDNNGMWTALRTMDMDQNNIHRFWAAVTLPQDVPSVR